MKINSRDSFKSLKKIKIDNKIYNIFSLKEAEKNGLKGISKLPKSIKVLLENLLRFEDGKTVKKEQILSFGSFFFNFTASLIAARSAIAGMPV